ncbi:MAG: alpha/beta hydrolase, partial [Sphingomonas sp.]
VTSAQKPDEIDAARSILAAVPAAGKQQFVPAKGGVHGSSTLIPARNPIGAEAAWTAVLGFLDAVTRR